MYTLKDLLEARDSVVKEKARLSSTLAIIENEIAKRLTQ